MGVIYIENRKYAQDSAHYNPLTLSDSLDVKLNPQRMIHGESLIPEISFAISNTHDVLMLIHVALADDGKYYFGYTIYIDDTFLGCAPFPDLRISEGHDTLFACLEAGLSHCSTLSKYYGFEPDSRIKTSCLKASRDLNKIRLKQFSIFDYL